MTLDTSPVPKSQIQSPTVSDPSPLQNLVDEYLLNCTIEGKTNDTLGTYAYRLNVFLKQCDSLNTFDIRLYFKKLIDKGLAASTRNAYYRALHAFFEWLVDEGRLEESPMKNIKPPKLPKNLPKSFPSEDVQKLLLLTSGNRFLEIRNRAMFLMFLDTGLRLKELAMLQTNQVNILTGVIRIMGKGSKERVVRIGKATRKAINRYLYMRKDGYPALWVSEERQPLTRAGVKITVKKLCIHAGIAGGPHKIRHTFAVNYLRNGGDLATLQIIMGHSDIKTTRIYLSGLAEEDIIRVHEKASPVDRIVK